MNLSEIFFARLLYKQIEALQNKDVETRREACISFLELKDIPKEAITALIKCLGDEDSVVRKSAFEALEKAIKCGENDYICISMLNDALNDNNNVSLIKESIYILLASFVKNFIEDLRNDN